MRVSKGRIKTNSELSIGERWNNRALLSLLWPLILEQLLNLGIGAADMIMVSSLGEYAVSAVNIIDNINNLLIIAFTALCTGGAVVVSQYIGRRDHNNSSLAAKQLVYSVMLIAFLVMGFTILFRRPLIRVIYGNIEADVMSASAVYLLFIGMSYPFLALNSANSALFRAMGNSRIPMLIGILANVVNITGNFVFIFSLNMGVMGAALATFLCRVAAAAISTTLLYRNKSSPISLSGLFNIHINPSMIKNILNVGVPSGVESSMFMVGRLMTQRIFTVFGTAAMAANAVASLINSLSFMPGMAFGMAMLTITGQCIGAGDYTEAKKQVFKIMKLAYITLIILSAFILIFIKPLVSLFNLGPEAGQMAILYLRVHCVTMALGWALSFCLPNALRAAGDARYVMISAVISVWTVRVILAYLLTFTFGIGPLAVWLAMGADFFVRGGLFYRRWRSGKWQNKRVIDD